VTAVAAAGIRDWIEVLQWIAAAWYVAMLLVATGWSQAGLAGNPMKVVSILPEQTTNGVGIVIARPATQRLMPPVGRHQNTVHDGVKDRRVLAVPRMCSGRALEETRYPRTRVAYRHVH
jgi:hypothetical protein